MCAILVEHHIYSSLCSSNEKWLLMLCLDCNSDVRNFVSNAGEENLLMNPSGSILPASKLTLLRFVSFKSTTCGADSIGVYLSAIRHLQIANGFDNSLNCYSRVPLV